jgi:hypothetical protein
LRDPTTALPKQDPHLRWMARFGKDADKVALGAAGKIPYYVDGPRYIDVLGLNTSEIAHHGQFDPAGPIDSKTDMVFVLNEKPDVLDGLMSATDLLDCEELSLEKLSAGARRVLAVPSFARDYYLVTNVPYSEWDRAVFVRKSFWASHPQRDEIDVVELQKTALAPHLSARRPAQ